MNIGDKVAVLDEDLEGIIISIDEQRITIETKDGFPLEFQSNELVLVTEDQASMAKFSDISNEHLIEKQTATAKHKSLFKSDNKKDKPPMEVDLHIHHLTASTKGMDNYDILNIQMDTAKQKLEFAIRNRIQRIVFIHGKGAGVLKTELEFLFKNYPVKWYAASFKKYGLGATEVYVFQNPKAGR
jgi:dsDNA-specific endonuclease/ATPase MutS2